MTIRIHGLLSVLLILVMTAHADTEPEGIGGTGLTEDIGEGIGGTGKHPGHSDQIPELPEIPEIPERPEWIDVGDMDGATSDATDDSGVESPDNEPEASQ